MSIRYILFDLDGTLLPMDQDHFIQTYLHALSTFMESHGFEPNHFMKTIWNCTAAMFKNNSLQSNEQVFWQTFTSVYGPDARQYEPIFNTFYHTHFTKVKSACGFDPKSAATIQKLRNMGFKTVLATQPIFPSIATETRMGWAGLRQDDFLLYTTYENSNSCKPNPAYYQQILDRIGAQPCECLMVGNDATEDMIAQTLGMNVFLLTNCLINKDNKDLSEYPQGDFDALLNYIQSI